MTNNPLSMQVDLDPNDFLPASEEEKEYMVQMRPSSTFFRDGCKRLYKNKVAFISMIVIILITVASIVLPMIWPYSYAKQLGNQPGRPVDPSFNNLAPMEYSASEQERMEAGESVFPHIFGTDSSGRDYFIRVVYGTRISLAVGFFASIIVLVIGMTFASIIVLVIGMTLGSIAGFAGGRVDMIIMRIVDIIYSLPDMLMVILLASVLRETLGPILEGTVLQTIGSNIIALFVIFALLYWCSMARLIRGQILSLREQEYVLAAETAGAGSGWIIKTHLHRPADPQRHLHRELPVVPWPGRQRAYAVAGLACLRGPQRCHELRLPPRDSRHRHLAHRAWPQPLWRRPARRVRPQAQRLERRHQWHFWKYVTCTRRSSPMQAR